MTMQVNDEYSFLELYLEMDICPYLSDTVLILPPTKISAFKVIESDQVSIFCFMVLATNPCKNAIHSYSLLYPFARYTHRKFRLEAFKESLTPTTRFGT